MRRYINHLVNFGEFTMISVKGWLTAFLEYSRKDGRLPEA
jgi:hypothetical protein